MGKKMSKSEKKTNRPAKCETEHLVFLDDLRNAGTHNMFGARAPLMQVYDELTQKEASDILKYWMDTFGKDDR